MKEEFDIKSFAANLSDSIAAFKKLKDAGNGKWIVAGNTHVYVGDKLGLNGLGFHVRGVLHSHYPEFDSYDEAQRHIDPYLIDGAGKPIYNKPIEATVFYAEEIDAIERCLNWLQENRTKKTAV